jgi:acyl-CoA dehydrogenase
MKFSENAATGAGGKADESLARQAASALYHVTSAVVMAQEAEALSGDVRRLLLAQLVLEHRVLPRDPLFPEDSGREAEFAAALLSEAPMATQTII